MKLLTAALTAAILVAGNPGFAACNGVTAEKQAPQTTAELPDLPPEKAGS